MKNRLLVAIPLFVIGFFLSKVDFNIVWRYFGFTNQLIATIVLWTSTAYFVKNLGINEHYSSIQKGVIDTRDILYFLSLIVVFLLATKLSLKRLK